MTFQAGELDQLITIIRPVKSDDGMGGKYVDEPQIIAANLWAKRRALSGKEFAKYEQVNATAMCAFVIRYRDDLLPSDQIISEGVAYNIRYIPPVSSRSLYLVIDAESGVAQ